MDKVGYIDNEAGQKLKVEFVLDKSHNVMPKSENDKENLIDCWGINDEILEAFINFVNNKATDDKEKITLLTNVQEYRFLESEEVYNVVTFKLGEEATQEKIETLIDKIYDDAIFGYDNLMLCAKEKL